jgi:hypothetical protein
MSDLPGPKEAMLNGLPLSEVQRREKRGQIISYGDRATNPRAGARDIVHSSAQAGRSWTSHGPISSHSNLSGQKDVLLLMEKALPRRGVLPPMQERKAFMNQAELSGVPKARLAWYAYRRAIDRQLAKTSLLNLSHLNMLRLAAILGLGVWLPVRLILLVPLLILGEISGLKPLVITLNLLVPLIAVGYFMVRKISGKLDIED